MKTKDRVIARSLQELAPAFNAVQRDSPDKRREKARDIKGRLIFDCYNAKVLGERVHCKHTKFKAGGKLGTVTAKRVLTGLKPSECQTCKHYDDGGQDGDGGME